MTEPEQIAAAHKLLVKWVTLIAIITVIVCGWMIYVGENTEWASLDTINGPPSIEITP